MRNIIAVALGVALLNSASVAMAACDPGETVIKFSHVVNGEKHPKGIAANMLAKRVNEEMNGKACMEVFANSSLYTDEKVLEAMLSGDVQLAAPSLSLFEPITKKFRIFDLPFLFDDVAAVDRFQSSKAGAGLLDVMKRRGIHGVAYWHNGMKQLSANKPLLMPDDAKGLKFRVQPSEVLVAQFQALGANPQKLAFSETYGALQTKVVDGQENTWSNIYGQKFFEVQDGISETNHGVIDYLVVTSTEWLKKLKPDVREQLLKLIKEVTDDRNGDSAKVNQEAKQAIIKAGGVVRDLTAEQRAAWVKAMKPVWAKFEGEIGADLIAAAERTNQ